MGAAGDVEEQAVRRVERDQRREAIAPVGDIAERLGVRRLIGVKDFQMRTDGAGIGERKSDVQTKVRGSIVQRIDLQRVVLFGDDDAWRVIQRGGADYELALDAVDGQARQPQAENSSPVV